METNKTPSRIHPLVAAASASVILVSLVGVAAITGILPTSHGTVAPAAPVAAMTTPAQDATVGTAPAAAAAAKPSASASRLAEIDAPAPASTKPAHSTVKPHKATTHPLAPNYAQTASAPQSAPAPVYAPAPTHVAQAPAPICHSCGRVEAVNAVQTQAAPSGLGAVAGGVVGGLLGNQVGGGNGRTLATVAGAVGGGFAGHEVEKRTRTATTYQVRVRMEDGRVRTFPYNNTPSWSVGDRVKVVDGYLSAQG